MAEWNRWLDHPIAQSFKGRDFLTLNDWQPEQLEWLLDFAVEMKKAGINGARGLLAGQSVGLIFEKPSTRTRVSFEVAVWQLGGTGLYLQTQEMQASRGETIEDTGRVLSRYVQGIVIRTFGQDRLEALAAGASVPVVNGLTDRFHPCQVAADLLTLKEHFGRLRGLRLVYLGDGNNMAHSLMVGGAKVGMHVTVCSPEGFGPDPEVVEMARRAAAETGAEITLSSDPGGAVAGADALYTDVWVSMGQEADPQERQAVFEPYRIDAGLLAKAAPHAVVLHCLPAHRGEEITSDVLDGPSSLVWDQAENRLHAQKAILAAILGDPA